MFGEEETHYHANESNPFTDFSAALPETLKVEKRVKPRTMRAAEKAVIT